jgi:serine phosphatase RsbU (regulator of sigma subunit)/HAMP domain-containing protein
VARRRFRFSLRNKLIALTTTIVAVVMTDVTYFLTIRELDAKKAGVTAQTDRVARSIATIKLLDRQDWTVYQNYISELIKLNDDIVYIAVYDDRGQLRAPAVNLRLISLPHGVLTPLPARAEADLVRQLDQGDVAAASRRDLLTHRVNIQRGDRVLGSVHVGVSLIDINDQRAAGIQRNVSMALLLVLAGGALAYVLSRRLTRPLERLAAAMDAIGEGDLEQRVKVETHDEIGELAGRFNEMVEELRERQVIDRLGHELGGTFQFERLAHLVRERVSGAVGAAFARLHVRRRDRAGCFEEVALPGNGESALPRALQLDDEQQAALGRSEGFMLPAAPAGLAAALIASGLTSRDFVIPMPVQGVLFGLLSLRLRDGAADFDPKQKSFLGTLARQAALALENALLYDELKEQERMRKELEIAAAVQRSLLPAAMPSLAGFDLDGICLPAHEVGGDYFDFFDLGPGRMGIAIADVAGKGTSASFYMAEIKGMMLALTAIFPSPRRLFAELNLRLHQSLEPQVFASMLYGVLDAPARRFTFARAGHTPPLWVRRDDVLVPTPPGMALGIDPGPLFEKVTEEHVVDLAPGEALVLYTDGITEAMSPGHESFGMTRLCGAAGGAGLASAAALRQRILEAVAAFSDGAAQADDLTMVVIRASDETRTAGERGTRT